MAPPLFGYARGTPAMSNAIRGNLIDSVKLLKAEQVADLLAIHVRSVWRQSSAGELPKPVRIGGATRWRLADIKAFIADQIGGRG